LRSRHPKIVAIGVGMPGFVNFDEGMVHTLTNVPGWDNFPLKKVLEERIGLPVVVDNDANCMAYAEWKRGAGRGMNDLIAVTLGTGVGGGVIANGQMVRGCRFGAGELGQSSIDWQGREGHYGNRGAIEQYVGNRQIAARAVELYEQNGQSRTLSDCSPAMLSTAAYRGDEVALALWDEVARRLSTALMNACWLLNPRAIVIGGGVARAGDVLFSPLTTHLYSQMSSPFKEHLMVLPARFGNEAGSIGAAAMALESTV
ncbi:MAG: ROK family protein, partial [Verrucomicrobiales bacterium]